MNKGWTFTKYQFNSLKFIWKGDILNCYQSHNCKLQWSWHAETGLHHYDCWCPRAKQVPGHLQQCWLGWLNYQNIIGTIIVSIILLCSMENWLLFPDWDRRSSPDLWWVAGVSCQCGFWPNPRGGHYGYLPVIQWAWWGTPLWSGSAGTAASVFTSIVLTQVTIV